MNSETLIEGQVDLEDVVRENKAEFQTSEDMAPKALTKVPTCVDSRLPVHNKDHCK